MREQVKKKKKVRLLDGVGENCQPLLLLCFVVPGWGLFFLVDHHRVDTGHDVDREAVVDDVVCKPPRWPTGPA